MDERPDLVALEALAGQVPHRLVLVLGSGCGSPAPSMIQSRQPARRSSLSRASRWLRPREAPPSSNVRENPGCARVHQPFRHGVDRYASHSLSRARVPFDQSGKDSTPLLGVERVHKMSIMREQTGSVKGARTAKATKTPLVKGWAMVYKSCGGRFGVSIKAMGERWH